MVTERIEGRIIAAAVPVIVSENSGDVDSQVTTKT
jgi:hypothetical protein